MAHVQLEAYILDSLMPDLVGHDRRPSAFITYLFLRRQAARSDSRVQVSLRDIAEGTGLSKRAVQDALRVLERRQLVRSWQAHLTAVPEYQVLRPWHRESARTKSL
jgi:DNA-binding MarR family transcriptional regulator